MMMMTICIDWLGRTQRGLSEINRSEGEGDPDQMDQMEKRQKYEKTKIQNTKYKMQIQNTDCKKMSKNYRP